VDFRPLNVDLRAAAERFAARIPDQDRSFLDPFLLYQVAVASWTQPTPARRIAAVDTENGVEELVGLLTVVPGTGWQSHVGELRVVVLPGQRGRGIGRRLIEQGLALARELRLSKVTTEIMASNDSGLRLFESFGFVREAVLANHVRDGEGRLQDLVVTSLELSDAPT
jgi:ribosomal protein S18 acetylase RimI-like enzyme